MYYTSALFKTEVNFKLLFINKIEKDQNKFLKINTQATQ